MSGKNVKEAGPVDSNHIARCLDAGDDFSFEMQVLNLLKSTDYRKVDLRVEHGGTYIDPVSKLARQFDIRARFARETPDNKWFWKLRVALECKMLHPSAPMVVSRSKRGAGESHHYYISAAADGLTSMNSKVTKAYSNTSFYIPDQFVGRSVTQVKAGNEKALGDGDIYIKWAQALASADDLVWEGLTDVAGKDSIVVSATLPILVVPNDSLWVVDYDSDGRRSSPTLAESCEFYVGKPASLRPGIGKFVITHLHIYTVEGLRKFLTNSVNETYFWLDHFPSK